MKQKLTRGTQRTTELMVGYDVIKVSRGTQRTTGLMVEYDVIKVSRLLSGQDLAGCARNFKIYLFTELLKFICLDY